MDLIIQLAEKELKKQEEKVAHAKQKLNDETAIHQQAINVAQVAYDIEETRYLKLEQQLKELKADKVQKPVQNALLSEIETVYKPTGDSKHLINDPKAKVLQFGPNDRHLVCKRMWASNKANLPKVHELRKMFHYDNETNRLYRKDADGNVIFDDKKPVGQLTSGYVPIIMINGIDYPMWEVIYFLREGVVPNCIGFKDSDSRNFRKENLRPYGTQLAKFK